MTYRRVAASYHPVRTEGFAWIPTVASRLAAGMKDTQWRWSCFVADALTESGGAEIIDAWFAHMWEVRERLDPDGGKPNAFHWSPERPMPRFSLKSTTIPNYSILAQPGSFAKPRLREQRTINRLSQRLPFLVYVLYAGLRQAIVFRPLALSDEDGKLRNFTILAYRWARGRLIR